MRCTPARLASAANVSAIFFSVAPKSSPVPIEWSR